MDQAVAGIGAMPRAAEDGLERQLASVAGAADVASAAESHCSDLHARLIDGQAHVARLEKTCSELHDRPLDWQAHAKLLEKVLEDERCAHAAQLEERDRALEAGRRALAAQVEESERVLENAAQLEEINRALEEERRARAAQLEETRRALDAEGFARTAQLKEKDRAPEEEQRALAAQLEEKDRASEAERRAHTTQLEERDRKRDTERILTRRVHAAKLEELSLAHERKRRACTAEFEELFKRKVKKAVSEVCRAKREALDAERHAHTAQLEERDRELEAERRTFAARLEEKDRALDAERRARTAQLELLGRALEAERRAFAARLEEKDRALDAERRALAAQAGAQGVSRVTGQGVTWQYCVKNQWIEMPSECALELTRRYQAGPAGDGGGDAMSSFSCQSGTERYEFNLRAMQQKNLRTLTQRNIQCVVHCPAHWTRCRSLDAIQKASATLTRTVELKGFRGAGHDGVYVESAYDSHAGAALWWKHDGSRYIQWNRHQRAWQLCSVGRDYLHRRNGSGVFDAESREDPDHGGSWVERTTEADVYIVNVPVTVHLTVPAPANPTPPFMNIVVELLDRPTREWFRNLLFDTAVHQQPCAAKQSICALFKHTFELVRVLRVENWHLLAKYRSHVHHMKQDMEKYGIRPAAVEPRHPRALDETLAYYGGGDADINECFLFHGTSSQGAASIAQEGFDFRLARAGHYGRGTYFAGQSCKSFQYTDGDGDELRTIVVSRVALGDVMYAPKVDKQCGRPELRDGTPRCYDSIVANPGPMPGHQHGQQAHQEFVIFENFQAYPEFLVQFTCPA